MEYWNLVWARFKIGNADIIVYSKPLATSKTSKNRRKPSKTDAVLKFDKTKNSNIWYLSYKTISMDIAKMRANWKTFNETIWIFQNKFNDLIIYSRINPVN